MLALIDEYTRECLAIRLGRKLRHEDVIGQLAERLCRRGVPEHIRSDNGSEFTAGSKNLDQRWRIDDNTQRPHSALDYRPPAPEACCWPRGQQQAPQQTIRDHALLT